MDPGRICMARREICICGPALCKSTPPGSYLGGRLLEHAPRKIGVGEGALEKMKEVRDKW